MGAAVRLIITNVTVLPVLVALVEGLASLVFFARDVGNPPAYAEHRHTAHDPDLGWANVPRQHFPDFYQRGAALTTNNRGFRGREDVLPTVPAGQRRLICSGDSFTLGYGVDDSATWCHRLALHDPALQTVNMGQGGYGFDQAYLWYLRDGEPLTHHVHVFAFITDDFRRMSLSEFGGSAKPRLALEAGRVVTRNTPVPAPSFSLTTWLTRHQPTLERLRSVDLIMKMGRRLAGEPDMVASHAAWQPEALGDVVSGVLDDLARRHSKAGRRFLAVHLPTRHELAAGGERAWTPVFADAANRHGFEFIDLFDHFEAMPAAERNAMFIAEGVIPFVGADGHYTEAGNMVVAERLAAVLAGSPPAMPQR